MASSALIKVGLCSPGRSLGLFAIHIHEFHATQMAKRAALINSWYFDELMRAIKVQANGRF